MIIKVSVVKSYLSDGSHVFSVMIDDGYGNKIELDAISLKDAVALSTGISTLVKKHTVESIQVEG